MDLNLNFIHQQLFSRTDDKRGKTIFHKITTYFLKIPLSFSPTFSIKLLKIQPQKSHHSMD